MKRKYHNLAYHTMMIPAMVFLIIFSIVPLIGYVMAFQRYNPMKPFFGLTSPWIGFQNFYTIFFMRADTRQVIVNTLIISISKLAMNIIVPVIFALLLNEVFHRKFKRVVQTVVYLPYFLSWVVAAAMFMQIFSTTGLLNTALTGLGIMKDPVLFLGSNTWFRPIIILTDSWKNFGFSAIVYISAITAIDLNLYEAADMDGANRWQKMRYVTFPGILPIVIVMSVLALGGILSAGQDQILAMYNPMVYKSGDVLDTFVYRVGLLGLKYDIGTAVGLVKSFISMLLIILSYKLADRFANYRIW
ncbi:MAG: ABC transporter permease subunit [Defluviitaleaceae bacterium]|nr:ABC transporter permease subunit [Defluviitaleaceae bacterium]